MRVTDGRKTRSAAKTESARSESFDTDEVTTAVEVPVNIGTSNIEIELDNACYKDEMMVEKLVKEPKSAMAWLPLPVAMVTMARRTCQLRRKS